MGFITPEEIVAKVKNAYARFLVEWISGNAAAVFPLRIRANLKLDSSNPKAVIASIEKLLSKSKEKRGWGYTVNRSESRSRTFGKNLVPQSIWIDSIEDLLRLSEVEEEFRFTQTFVGKVRECFPKLEDWIRRNVKTLYKHHDAMDGLIAVTKYFIENPWPDCYCRQLPVEVDTKFVSRNEKVLKQWLDELLPDSAIDPNETKFARRFGLRDGQTHRGIRFLDLGLMREVGESHAELSLPIRTIAELSVTNTTVFVVENRLNLLTLPDFEGGIAIEGEGNAVNRLEPVSWLRQNRIIYWGDNDVEGFLILSRLRNIFPHVESIMMDLATIEAHRCWCVEGNSNQTSSPTNLTAVELEAFLVCGAENLRLEQEKILQPFVDAMIEKLADHSR